MTWTVKKTIDEKKKTGDHEQIGFIWAAYQCICEGSVDVRSEAFETDRKKFLQQALDSSTSKVKKDEVRYLFKDFKDCLPKEYTQFLVNLAMINYRTGGGGRARRIADWLREGSDEVSLDAYVRPFEDPLPEGVKYLLSALDSRPLTLGAGSLAVSGWKLSDTWYVPPSRFTVTFPLALTGSESEPRSLVSPQVPNGSLQKNPAIQFAYMGSFGFAEPSYTTWVEGDGNGTSPEYAGTRLSLGAYSLNETYLTHVQNLLKQVKESSVADHKKGFKGYGGARSAHIESVLKVAKTSGHELALRWAFQMVEIASCLVKAALQSVKTDSQPGLALFFDYIEARIERRAEKLEVLKKGAKDLTHFEYIWVQESALWELALLGASCLTLQELHTALDECSALSGQWKPSLSDAEDAIHEVLTNIPTEQGGPATFQRIYTPTGMVAGRTLNELLMKSGFATHVVKSDKETLNPFTPYFEFYQGGFLSNETTSSAKGLQIWVNLSESLHSDLVKKKIQHKKAGEFIAKQLAEYLGTSQFGTQHNRLLVIDFTKLGGEMPNSVLYPILAQLAGCLIDVKAVTSVVFLRSNLKYNSGSLDRYQSGELLVYGNDHTTLVQGLVSRTKEIFKQGVDPYDPDPKLWSLCGEYVSLMRKVYLLSDAVSSGRWAAYAARWG